MLQEDLIALDCVKPEFARRHTSTYYMSSAHAVREAPWIRKLFGYFGIEVGTMPIYTDSQGALKLLKHPIASIRSKNIDVIHHFARLEGVPQGSSF